MLFVVSALLLYAGAAQAQPECQVKVFQGGQEVVSSRPFPVLIFQLKPEEFKVEVSPLRCTPTIATVPNESIARQIVAQPLVYSMRFAFLMAAAAEDSDQLLWWSRTNFDPEFRKPPEPASFEGKQYLRLCEELKFCPNVYPTFSSGAPFNEDKEGDKQVATFRKLDNKRSLTAAKGQTVLSVFYAVWRKLQSQYAQQESSSLLLRPIFAYFNFD